MIGPSALEPQLVDDSAFADALLGAARYFELFAAALQHQADHPQGSEDATSELLCDALTGIASLRTTCLQIFEAAGVCQQPQSSATPRASWHRGHLR
jgi:hypothetical protein